MLAKAYAILKMETNNYWANDFYFSSSIFLNLKRASHLI